MKISVCMITKNEEKNIARSIQSYRDAVDEIIVVDSESTDDTAKIAKSLGADVYIRPWTNDFAAARNYAIEQAQGDWIMIMDADEYMAVECASRIREVIAEAEAQDCRSILFRGHDIDEHTGKPDGVVTVERIFKNHCGIRYEGRIHEMLQSQTGPWKRLNTDKLKAYHTGYQSGVIRDKIQRNLAILQEKDLVLTPAWRRPLYLAENYYALRMHRETIQACEQVMSVPDWKEIALHTGKGCKVYVYCLSAMLGLSERSAGLAGDVTEAGGYTEEAIGTLAKEAVAKLPGHPEIKYMQCLFFIHFERIDEAIEAFHEALELDAAYDEMYENMFANSMDEKYIRLAQLYRIKNDTDRAATILLRSLSANPGNQDALTEFLLLRRKEDAQQTRMMLETVCKDESVRQKQAIMQAAWLAGCNSLFAIYFLEILKEQPELLATEKSFLCKIFLLQENYQGILDQTGENPSDPMQACFAFIARLALGRADRYEEPVDESFFLSVVMELLQSDATALLDRLLAQEDVLDAVQQEDPEKQTGMGRLFERFGYYEKAIDYFRKAAGGFSDCARKKECLVQAARSAYCMGAYEQAMDILDEAANAERTGRYAGEAGGLKPSCGHLDEELRRWIGMKRKTAG